jgi:hypothetical protein
MISHASLDHLSGNICMLHPSPRPTAHPALCTGPSQGEVSLCTSSAHIVRTSPHLESFELVFPHTNTRAGSFPTPTLPISRSCSTSSHHNYTPMRVQALFTFSTDVHGLPLVLHIVERCTCLFWPGSKIHLIGDWSSPPHALTGQKRQHEHQSF